MERKSSLDWKWVVVVGALLSRIITTGTVICLGVFLEDVKSSFPQLTNINSKISTIFGTASGLLEGTGILASLLVLKFEARYLVIIGALMATVSVLTSCFMYNYVALLILWGIVNGVGQGFARCLLPVAVSHSFDDKTRHIGISIQNSGDGFGGVIFPILLTYLIEFYTWRNALLITSAIIFNLVLCGAVIPLKIVRPEKLFSKRKSTSVAKDGVSLFPNVIFFYLNILSHSIAYFIFMIFVYNDFKEQEIDPAVASAIFAMVGGVSIFGRLSVSLMDNKKVPRWMIYSSMHVARGLIVMCFNVVPNENKVVIYFILCGVFGMTDGITGALIPMMCLDLFGLTRLAMIFGWEMFFMGLGAFLGVPIAGAMKDAFNSYKIPLMFSGFSFIFAGLILLPLHWTKKHYQIVQNPIEALNEENDKELETFSS